MRSKESPSLYEILRSASRSSGAGLQSPSNGGSESATATEEASRKQSLQERLEAYKAAKLVDVAPAVEPRPRLTPALPPQAAPGMTAQAGPGERVIRLTYNTAAFVGLVGLVLMFLAYSIGVRSGRADAGPAVAASVETPAAPAETSAPSVAPSPAPTPVAAAPKRVFSIHLIEWAAGTPQKRLEATRYANKFKKALDQGGHPGVKAMLVKRAGKEYAALYIGNFTSRSSPEAKAKLAAIRRFKYNGRAYFSRAGFEDITP